MENILSQRYVYKIPSQYLQDNNWSIDIDIKKARKMKMVVQLSSSEAIRFMDDISKSGFSEKKVAKLKHNIEKSLKKRTNDNQRSVIKGSYAELNKLLLVDGYVIIIMDSDKQYDRAVEGFYINGSKYVRMLSTSGGVKNSAIIFIKEEYKEEMIERINCGRNMEKKFVPGKLSSYMGLTCSSSIPVSNPNGVLVVKDCETEFTSTVIEVDDTKTEYPLVELKENYPIKLNSSDGFGLISYEMAEKWSNDLNMDYVPSGFTIRNAYCKGMLFVFDFKKFSKEIAKKDVVKDVWGDEKNINDIDIVLTESMLKLWDSYDSWKHYEECYKKYKYSFSVTKTTPKELDEERRLNYQFIQSLDLTDEMIDELIKPTVDEIRDVLDTDYKKSIIYTKGMNVTDDNVSLSGHAFVKALMIDERMIHNPFVKEKIRTMIRKRADESKKGKLRASGNFQILSGDPYSLCQSFFGLEVTGLLKSGEIYSKFWIDKGVSEIVGMRAPMTTSQNIVKMKVPCDSNMLEWYKHMNTVTILNSFDTTCAALNGADFD